MTHPDPVQGRQNSPALVSFKDMPDWFQQDNNKWIVHYYRPISSSTTASFRSWWYLHNETINIYSHLVPAIVFFFGEWYLLYYLAGKYTRANSGDLLAFSSFMISGTTCYTFSALYHTLMNHSYTVDHFWHRLDMLGIGLFIVGDIILGIYLIFWCETKLRNIYWSTVGGFGVSTIIANVHPKLQSHKHRSVRILAFVALGISVVAPLVHGLIIFGLDLMNKKAFAYTVCAKIGCLILGTLLYAMRFPESSWPGKFDMCSSHSLMHMLVVGAAVIQMIGYLEAFDYAYSSITCPAS